MILMKNIQRQSEIFVKNTIYSKNRPQKMAEYVYKVNSDEMESGLKNEIAIRCKQNQDKPNSRIYKL